jgi:hypothetical protein
MSTKNHTSRYFSLVRQHLSQESITDCLIGLVDSAQDALVQGKTEGALNILQQLKAVLFEIKPYYDKDIERVHSDLTEIMTLRKTVLELLKSNAELRGDDDAAAMAESQLGQMDNFFTEAITDLDPDSKA